MKTKLLSLFVWVYFFGQGEPPIGQIKSPHSFSLDSSQITLVVQNTIDTSSCRYKDSLELIKIYKATDGPNWTNKWDLTQPMREWHGIELTENGCVKLISLDNNNLHGVLPDLILPELGGLFLDNNKLSGNIPSLKCPLLYLLDLSENQLSGSIPDFDFPKMRQLILYRNQLSGTIPNFNFPHLFDLHLSYNLLTGSIPNFNLPELIHLRIRENQLEGSIPNFNMPKLGRIDLAFNQLSGSIPNFTSPIVELQLNNNLLTGEIPNFSSRNLSSLILSNNKLSGEIPNLSSPNLYAMLLSSNQLTGNIPNFKLPKLIFLNLSNNMLSGNIPMFDGATLREIILNNNQLTGPIPSFVLPNLSQLVLSNNNLSGKIPDLSLPNLSNLNISNNQLTGNAPNWYLPKIYTLDVSSNKLTGHFSTSNILTLSGLNIQNNKIDSLGNLSNIKLKSDTIIKASESRTFTFIFGLRVQMNKLTFSQIIQNIGIVNKASFIYSPQDSIFQHITYTKTVGQSITINLKIDSTITDNLYKWYRLGKTDTLILNTNKRNFNSLKVEDSGTYYVQVRNPQAPQLTLYSRAIHINVSDAGVLKSEAVDQKVCVNTPIPLSFNSAITYAADNEFKVELSESANNFNNAVSIGVLRSDKAQGIIVTLPTTYSPQKNYYYRIVASNPRVVSNISTFKINLELPIPAPVIKCAQTTGNSITFSWEAITGATGYQARSLSGGSGARNGNSVTFSNLTLNTSISLEVASQGASSCPVARDTQTCKTLNCAEVVQAGEPEPPFFICDGQNAPVILNDRLRGEDTNGRWSTNSGLNSQTFDADAGILHPQSLKADQYRFTYTVAGKNGCPSSAQNVLIVVGQRPKINQQEYTTCLNAKGKVQIQLSAVARSVNQQYAESIIWFKNANKKDTLKQASLELAAPLRIYAQIGQGACASELSPILLNPQPKLPLPVIEGETIVKVGDTIKLYTTQKYPDQSLFNWKIIQGKKFTDIKVIPGRDLYALPPIIAAKSDAGRYALSVKAPTEPPVCVSDEASVDLEVRSAEEHQLNIGKIASKSNPWKVEGLDQYPQYQIQVFNRWGERVFQAKSEYLNPWAGTYQDKQLPQGTYYYQIDIPGLGPIFGAVYVL